MNLSSILSKARKRGKQGKAYHGKGKRTDTAEGYQYSYDDPTGSARTAREAVDEVMEGAERPVPGKPPGWVEVYEDGEWGENRGGWTYTKKTNSYQHRSRGGWTHWTAQPQLLPPPEPIQDLMTNDLDTAVRRQQEHGVPIIVSLGLGVDSTGILVGLVERGIRPDAILFADTGGERSKITDAEIAAGRMDTYGMLPVLDQWLVENGMPGITVLRKVPTLHGKSGIEYYSLETECYAGVTKPSMAFGGGRGCSAKWKKDVQNKWAVQFSESAQGAWAQGFQVTKIIGYSADDADARRPSIADDAQYTYVYPLREWGWTRKDSKDAIRDVGLPVPVKSACVYCPVGRPFELRNIVEANPDAGRRIVSMELMSAPNDIKVDGLWGESPIKGYRGASKKPTSMTQLIVGEELLPEFEGIGREMAPPWWLAEGPVANPPRDFTLKDERLREKLWGLLRPTSPPPPRDLPGLIMIGESRNKVQKEKREREAAEDAMQPDLFAMSFFEDTVDLVKAHWFASVGLTKKQGHKYLRRLGTPGHYNYIYEEAKGRAISQVREAAPALHGALYEAYDAMVENAQDDPNFVWGLERDELDEHSPQKALLDALTLFTNGNVASVRDPARHDGRVAEVEGPGLYAIDQAEKADYIKAHAVMKALCERPLPKGEIDTVYRGMRLSTPVLNAILADADKNLGFDFSIIGSWSPTKSEADGWAISRTQDARHMASKAGAEYVPVVFQLAPETGSYIRDLSAHPDEDEFITGGTMRIKRVVSTKIKKPLSRYVGWGPGFEPPEWDGYTIELEQVMQKSLGMLAMHILAELDSEFDIPANRMMRKGFQALLKAQQSGHKYIRRTPTGDPKRPWRYYYAESSVARSAVAGETIRVKGHSLEVLSVDDDKLEVEWDGKKLTLSHDEWAEKMRKVAGDAYMASAEKRARQHANAILRHVPRKLLADLEGDTDAMRMADLRARAPDVYRRLRKSFRRAGISTLDAQRSIRWTLARRGWVPEARATFLGAMLKPGTAWLTSQYRTVGAAAERIATSQAAPLDALEVRPEHIAAALDLPRTKKAVEKVIANADSELERLRRLMTRPRPMERGPPARQEKLDIHIPSGAIAQAMASEALAKLRFLVKAYPDMALDPTALAEVGAINEIQAAAPRAEPRTKGAECMLFIAGEGGQASQIKARYELREAKSVRPSHVPWEGFAENTEYPAGLQTRPYHTDKQLQQGVRDNAGLSPQRTPQPAFWVNTNPDSVNGPPMILENGTVLGGNSRAMSQQVIFTDPDLAGGEHDQRLRAYLKENAGQFGFTVDDVEALEHPMLVRVVEPEDTSDRNLKLLVQQMNENFTKGLDPRAMQVALGRRIDEDVLRALANEMDADESIDEFLDSSGLNEQGKPRNAAFLDQLRKVGLIDDRNANQYYRRGEGGDLVNKLNEDGKRLVSRVLLGHIINDVDLLSATVPDMVKSIARSVPYVIQVKTAGEGEYDIQEPLKHALDAYNDFVNRKLLPKAKDQKTIDDRIGKFFAQLKADLTDPKSGAQVFEPQPVETDPLVRQIFETLIRRGGPYQLAWVMQEYVAQVEKEQRAASDMFREKPAAAEFMENALQSGLKQAEVERARKAAAKKDKQAAAAKKKAKEAAAPLEQDGPERDDATMSMFDKTLKFWMQR